MKILQVTVSCAAMAMALVCTTVLPALAQEVACAPVDAVETAPPPLPTYDQPPVPGPGYLWSPGNWSWDEERADYYWVPGTWVEPPRPGLPILFDICGLARTQRSPVLWSGHFGFVSASRYASGQDIERSQAC